MRNWAHADWAAETAEARKWFLKWRGDPSINDIHEALREARIAGLREAVEIVKRQHGLGVLSVMQMSALVTEAIEEGGYGDKTTKTEALEVKHEDAWRDSMEQHPIESCGELDVATHLTGKVTVGRVSSAIIRYVYFEDGSEVVCVGAFADFVAFRAADYDKRIAELEDQLQDLNDELDQWREADGGPDDG